MTTFEKILSDNEKYNKWANNEDLIKHIKAFYERVMGCVEEYTGGYPYKQGNGWTDPQMNEKMVV